MSAAALGVLLLCFFIRDSWMSDAAAAAGGSWSALDQLGVQLVGMGATIALAVTVTLTLCFVIEKTIGFRVDAQSEAEGLDQTLHGENGYGLTDSSING